MKLLKTISLLIEQDLEDLGLSPSPSWHEKVFQSNSHDDLWPITKLMGGDIHEVFKALDNKEKGEDFLNHILYQWEHRQLPHIIDALGGMRAYLKGSMVYSDLLEEFVIGTYIEDIPDLEKKEDGRIILELMPGEQSRFFSGEGGRSYDCEDIAQQIFGEEGLGWEPYDEVDSIENLIKELSEENYIRLVRHIGIEFQNQEVDAWREEFEGWREEDQLPDGKVFLTAERMNNFLPDDEDKRYNLAVLIGNTPELEEIEREIQHSYSRAWNEVVVNQYYRDYYNAINELLGKQVGEGSTNTYKSIKDPETGHREHKLVKVPVTYYDITNLAKRFIVQHAYNVDSPEYFVEMYPHESESMVGIPGLLCPMVEDYPDDEEEVQDLFQEILWEYL